MAYRYTDTNKWGDSWFVNLRPIEKVLFEYLRDNCDIAGFIEVNVKQWANIIGSNQRDIEGALKGLSRGFIYSKSNDCIYLRTFLKHQKNLPLDPQKNPAHKGIIKRFDNYAYKFDIENVYEFIEGALKGLSRGIGNGNGIDNNNKEIDTTLSNSNIKTWRTSFEIYQSNLKEACNKIITPEYIKEREEYHPGLDIKLTLKKAYEDYWNKEAGWKNKKSSKTNEIDWKSTFNNSLSQKMNQVWISKEKQQPETPKYERASNRL